MSHETDKELDPNKLINNGYFYILYDYYEV